MLRDAGHEETSAFSEMLRYNLTDLVASINMIKLKEVAKHLGRNTTIYGQIFCLGI